MTPSATAGTVAGFRRSLLVCWAVASPLLLTAFTREWLFTPPGLIDAWHYVGFFLNYTEPRYWDDAYKLARLSWILPGAATYSINSDLAPYVLHAGGLLAMTSGLFLLVKELFGSFGIAALAAMLLGFYTHVHGSGGWDYHNTAAGPYYVWSLYILTRAARAPQTGILLLAGCFTALAVHANITLVNLLPILALHWLILRRAATAASGPTVRELARVTFWVAIGGVGLTGLLMAVNVAAGREPLFFNRLIGIVLQYAADPSQQASWWRPWNAGWIEHARHLALAAAVLLTSATMLLYPPSMRRLSVAHRLVLLEFVALSALWALWQSAGQTALDWDYFAYPLFPHAVLALSAVVHTRAPEAPWPVVLVAPVALAIPLAFSFETHLAQLAPQAYAIGSAVPGLALYVFAIAALWLPRLVALTAFTVFFAAANGVSAANSPYYALSNVCRVAPDFHYAVVSANQFVAQLDPRFKDINLWFDESETIPIGGRCTLRTADFGYALGGSGLPYVVTPFPMPSASALPAKVLEGLARSKIKILIVSGGARPEAELTRRLGELGLDSTVTVRRRLPVLDGAVDVIVLDVRLKSDIGAVSPAS